MKTKRWYFTLIELMIVMVIILSMGTVLSMNIVQAVKQQRFLSASREILNKMQMAQDLMLMQGTTVILTLTQQQTPKPHVLCTLEMCIHGEREGIKAMKKLLDTTNKIDGIGDIEFTDGTGTLQKENIQIKFKQPGNHITDGVLRLYANTRHDGQQQTIVVDEYPRPLKLIAGEPTKQPGDSMYTASKSSTLFPTEIYEKEKRTK